MAVSVSRLGLALTSIFPSDGQGGRGFIRSRPSLLTRLVEWAWPIAWSLAAVAIITGRAGGSRTVTGCLITAVGAMLVVRALLMLADYRGVLHEMKQRDQTRLGNQVSAALGLTLRSTRFTAALELVIALAWLGYGVAHVA